MERYVVRYHVPPSVYWILVESCTMEKAQELVEEQLHVERERIISVEKADDSYVADGIRVLYEN